MHVNTLHICYSLFPPFVTSPTITPFTFVLHLATESSSYPILQYPEKSTQYFYSNNIQFHQQDVTGSTTPVCLR